MMRSARWQALGARFDQQALRPPALAAGAGEMGLPATATAAALRAWCAQPDRLAQGWLPAGPGGSPAAAAWAEAFACGLDGSARLAALSRTAGLAWRLQVKCNDARWWRPRQPDDPWDAGWALDTAAGRQRLAGAFAPRRPTLVLAALPGQAGALPATLHALALRQGDWVHPVRWLWVGEGDAPPAPDVLPLRVFSPG